MKLWGGRFTKNTDKLVEEYTASISFDQKMAYEDAIGSMAHAKMLGKTGIISVSESAALISGLKTILDKLDKGFLEFSTSDEDIHMNIERMLTTLAGPVAGKLHTARSRNDQVTTDLHLYLRKRLLELGEILVEFQKTLLAQAKVNTETVLPGYTHLQRAQPILFSQHILAYLNMFARDTERLMDSWKRVNICPLGAGALAGTRFPIDREYTAKLLKFDGIYENSMDAVSDRDYLVEFLSNASICMMHLSRMSEELVLWSSNEFGFIELDDAYCTGSSIMPQKKNPDVPELVRGKTGRVYGSLISILTVLKSLSLTYNKDLQEDKEPLFDTLYTLSTALILFTGMLDTMKVNKDKMLKAVSEDFSNATDLADYLAGKGIPFREAHEITGRVVLDCIKSKKYLLELSLNDLKQYSDLFEEDIFSVLQPINVVNARAARGGTAKSSVEFQIEVAEKNIKTQEQWLKKTAEKINIDLADF